MDYANSADHLRGMVLLWPGNAGYWEMLASTYLELQDDGSALATLMVAYEYGLIEEESKLLNLIRLNLFLDVPYEAGEILETGLADGRIIESPENLQLLLSAWTAAREFNRAIAAVDRLAVLTDDGAYYAQKAQLLNEQARWADVIEAADQALALGGLEDTGNTLVLKGMAQAELGYYDEALATFDSAAALDSAAAGIAEAWSDYVRDRRQAVASQR
jgi:tetratricopeptide (TPR) repeat protein